MNAEEKRRRGAHLLAELRRLQNREESELLRELMSISADTDDDLAPRQRVAELKFARQPVASRNVHVGFGEAAVLVTPRTDVVPVLAEKIFSLVVSPNRLEEALGDLEQGFHRLTQRHGRPHAVRWYYWHVAGIAIGGLLKNLFRWRWWLLFFTSH